MKTLFIRDLATVLPSQSMVLCCWVRSRREKKGQVFLDVVDSTGKIQAVFDKNTASGETVKRAKESPIDASVELTGKVVQGVRCVVEFAAEDIRVVGHAEDAFKSIRPRMALPSWPNPSWKQVCQQLELRHLYIRNPRLMEILRFRYLVIKTLRYSESQSQNKTAAAKIDSISDSVTKSN